MKEDSVNNYYTKLVVGGKFSSELSNASYLVKELKRVRNSMENYRQRKAELRKEFFETLVMLRLNMDDLLNHLPHHEAALLKKKIDEIQKFEEKRKDLRRKEKKKDGKKAEKKVVKKGKKPVKKEIKKEEKKAEKKVVKPKSKFDNALESEKKELELLKRDLEDISRELRKKR